MSRYDYSTICRHVATETKETNCEVTGTVPSWLEGFAIYNGPGLTKVGEAEYNHAFDSSAVLQKISIENGRITYSTKYLQSETFKKNQKAQAIMVAEFGTPGPSNKGVLSRILSVADSEKMMSDNAGLGVVKLGDKFFAIGETPYFLQIDPKTMDVIDRVNMNKNHNLATQSIHVSSDKDGYYYTAGQAISMTGPKYGILRIPQDGNVAKAKMVSSVPCRWRLSPCYIHSVTFTENYLILIEPPLAVSIMDLLSDVITNTPFIEGLHWQNENAIFHIIDRKTWKPVASSYFCDPMFFLHFANAYEEDNHIVVDVCAYKDSSILNNMFIEKLRSGQQNSSPEFHESFRAHLKRFVLPLDPKSSGNSEELITLPQTLCTARKTKNGIHLTAEDVLDFPFENPTSNKKYSLKGNQFSWGLGPSPDFLDYSQIIKIDFKSRELKIFKEDCFYVCPPLFVASPDAQKEDDGVILFLALTSGKEQLVSVVILDACTMTELCRATTTIDTAVPMPLHGGFFRNA